ncbi:pyridoxamine 5'-phosphate oxidase family protein [Flexivirga sp.]|uniref:pyridoxamine 5'-phosphate oxidase family protein n=1 Tax=Flexivirga sp. TaxID=1962927 RepID=UPI003F7DFEB5
MQTSTHSRTQQLTTEQCIDLLTKAPVGRLGVVVAGRPEIYPVNHSVHEGDILFRTGSGTKLDAAVGEHVCFEADGFDAETETAWSVVVTGVATEVARLHEVLDLLRLPVFPWEPGAKPHLVRIHPETLTGRSFGAVDLLRTFAT